MKVAARSGTQPGLLAALPERERRGSRARCILLTDGPDDTVALRLSNLVAPYATIDPKRHTWMPRGFAATAEARLGEARQFLATETRAALTLWWLAVSHRANTPNWDIAATATINGVEGLVLVEAKAHANEIKDAGKPPGGNAANDARIAAAIGEAGAALCDVAPGWALTSSRCYQLCNRFAWGWKIASLGTPVLLVYLGFLRAGEMRDQGEPFADHADWEKLVRSHGRGLVPDDAWDRSFDIHGTPFRAIICSADIDLPVGPARA